MSEAVRMHVSERLGVPAADVDVAFLGLGRPLACPEDATILVDSRPGETFVGRADVQVMARDGEATCDRLRLRPRLEVWTEAPVAARPVEAGDVVELARGRVRLDTVQGVPVALDGGPYEARVPLSPGDPVTLQRVRRAPAARSGQPVTLVAGGAALRIEASGRLLQDAQVGETVRVANTATGVVVSGTLVEPGVVRAGGTR